MLSALARRAVPATANRLSSVAATGGARRSMGSAQSFVSARDFSRGPSAELICSYSLYGHYQRILLQITKPDGG